MSERWRFVVQQAAVVMLLVGYFPTIHAAVIGGEQEACTTSSNKAGYCMPKESCHGQEIVDLRTSGSCTDTSQYCCPNVENASSWDTRTQYTECDSNRGYCVKSDMCGVRTFRLRSNRCPAFEEVCCPKAAFQEKSTDPPNIAVTTSSTSTTTTTSTTTVSSIISTSTPELDTSTMNSIKKDDVASTTPLPDRSNASCIECPESQSSSSNTTTASTESAREAESIPTAEAHEAESKEDPTILDENVLPENTTSDTISTLLPEFTPENFAYRECGQRNRNGVVENTIDKDFRAEYGEIPWMVALLELPDKRYCCNGALINLTVILTTAHCITKCGGQVSQMVVRVGEWNMSSTVETEIPWKDIGVKSKHVHPKYSLSSLINNIAVLELNEPVQYQATVQPVCLPSPVYALKSQENMIATGWGAMIEGNTTSNQILKRLDLQRVESSICNQELEREDRRTFVLDGSFVCAGTNHKDRERPCKGDAGSPVVVEIPRKVDRYYLYGLVSWGYRCNQKRLKTTVLTNVGYFRNWIDETVETLNQNSRKSKGKSTGRI